MTMSDVVVFMLSVLEVVMITVFLGFGSYITYKCIKEISGDKE